MINFDLDKLVWVKNIKANGGLSWAYMDKIEGAEFNLHWNRSRGVNIDRPNRGDIIVLFQKYKSNNVRLTHLVEVLDENHFLDEDNEEAFQPARKVKVLMNASEIEMPEFNFKKVSYGYAYNIDNLSDLNIDIIKTKIHDAFYEYDKHTVKVVDDKIVIPPNKIYHEVQELFFKSKVVTLIGENGCGKSAILESLFLGARYTNEKFICFSSGQNECFTDIFKKQYFVKNKELIENPWQDDSVIKSFYFDASWAKFLIFFADVFKPLGNTRTFLRNKNLINIEGERDSTTILSLEVNISNIYCQRIKYILDRESEDSNYKSIRPTYLHQFLEQLINIYGDDYAFERSMRKVVELKDENLLDVFPNNISKIFSFFWNAIEIEHFIENSKVKLIFKDGLELNQLSDGEYQILTLYAIIDLFDSDSTVFLFDEIDTHLHHSFIKNVWSVLRTISGKMVTTTHIVDSVVLNQFDDIKLVEKGKVTNYPTINDIHNRLVNLTESDYYKIKVAANTEFLALIEDKTDWIIFEALAKKKLGNEFDDVKFSKIQFIKCPSGYLRDGDDFGNKKKQWVKDFKRYNSSIVTKDIFLLCDRDEFPINNLRCEQDPVSIAKPELLCKVIGDSLNNISEFKKGKKPHLLSWRRREIENYLVCNKVLEEHSLSQAFKNRYGTDNFPTVNCSKNNDALITGDFKELLKDYLYKSNSYGIIDIGRWDYNKLNLILNLIPASEVSDDIINTYKYIINRVN